jgi:hypothetical protein
VTINHLWESVRAVDGPGGKGGSVYPGMAIRIRDEDYVILRASDFLDLMREDIRTVKPTKAEIKRESAKIPKFLRPPEEE